MTHLEAGDKAPDFKAKDQDGNTVALKDFRGKKVVLYFYPEDDTEGCINEACNLRDNYRRFQKMGYVILGVSPDDEKSHRKFADKYKLPFTLLVDVDHKLIDAYGVWGEKTLFGRDYMGLLRTTFVINEKGIIEDVIRKVNTKEHTEQILK